MTKHVDSESDALLKHGAEIATFLERASRIEIQEQMAYLHGCLEEDVPSISCGKWNGDMISNCPVCKALAFEWSTLIHADIRPELAKMAW